MVRDITIFLMKTICLIIYLIMPLCLLTLPFTLFSPLLLSSLFVFSPPFFSSPLFSSLLCSALPFSLLFDTLRTSNGPLTKPAHYFCYKLDQSLHSASQVHCALCTRQCDSITSCVKLFAESGSPSTRAYCLFIVSPLFSSETLCGSARSRFVVA